MNWRILYKKRITDWRFLRFWYCVDVSRICWVLGRSDQLLKKGGKLCFLSIGGNPDSAVILSRCRFVPRSTKKGNPVKVRNYPRSCKFPSFKEEVFAKAKPLEIGKCLNPGSSGKASRTGQVRRPAGNAFFRAFGWKGRGKDAGNVSSWKGTSGPHGILGWLHFLPVLLEIWCFILSGLSVAGRGIGTMPLLARQAH